MFSLTLGEAESKLYHRIGKGKPFGMGAVKVRVEELKLLSYHIVNGKIERGDKIEDLAGYGLASGADENKYSLKRGN